MNRKQELEYLLESHDCHLTPYGEDGCQCTDLRVELAQINYKLKTVPYKYHSQLIKPPFTRDLEMALWNEVREDKI